MILVETTTWIFEVNAFCSVSALWFFPIILNLVYAFVAIFNEINNYLNLLRLKDFSLPVQNGGHFEKWT